MSTIYIDFYSLNEAQVAVIKLVEIWCKTNKKPIGHKEILKQMKFNKMQEYTTANAIKSVVKKGYLRRAVTSGNKTFYVLLRTLPKV
jgi:hypothetical protein